MGFPNIWLYFLKCYKVPYSPLSLSASGCNGNVTQTMGGPAFIPYILHFADQPKQPAKLSKLAF